MTTLYGDKHRALLAWLVEDWWPNGPAACWIEGFSGIGKTEITRQLQAALQNQRVRTVRIDVPATGDSQFDDLLLGLSQEFADVGEMGLATLVDQGADRPQLVRAVVATLRQPILLVLDDFQNALDSESGELTRPYVDLLKAVERLASPTGRLLMVTDRSARVAQWSEQVASRRVDGLSLGDGAAFLQSLLKERGQESEVSSSRLTDVVGWVGGNPRALRSIVAALRYEPLDALIGLQPESWELREQEVSPDLIRELERQLLSRVLERLSEVDHEVLFGISVLRKPFARDGLERFLSGKPKREQIRTRLTDNFLLKHDRGWYTLEKVAREIASRFLAENPNRFRGAHSIAADYYARHFRAQRIIGGGKLGGDFVEARFHLVQAGRQSEMRDIVSRFEAHVSTEITGVTPVPKDPRTLDERIAVLIALLGDQGAKTFEYHLAKCLRARGRPGDLQAALVRAHRSLGKQAPAETWVFALELAEYVEGLDAAIEVFHQGSAVVPPAQNLFSLYQSCAALMARANRLDQAIKLLEQGIVVPGMTSLSSLYQSCAELMAKAKRLDDAVDLLREGIAVPGMTSLSSLYQSCAELMVKANRLDDAIKLLEKGIAVPEMTNVFSLYQSCAELMVKANRLDDAIKLLEKGIAVSGMTSVVSLYQSCTDLMVKANRLEDAMSIVTNGLATLSKEQLRHKVAETALRNFGARNDSTAIRRLQAFTGSQQLEAPQLALADYLLIRISGDWVKAAEFAHKAHVQMPNYLPLRINEADALLALGQVEDANNLMEVYEPGQNQVTDNPPVWFKAYLALLVGNMADARTYAEAFCPDQFDPARALDEAEMHRLWSLARSGMNAPIEDNFPGLVVHRRHRQSESEAPEEQQTAQTPEQPCVLAVATEWDSRHGGLSTFNRDLCAALTSEGGRVVCYVPQASHDEVERARRVDVILVQAPALPGAEDVALLFQRPNLPPGFVPNIIVGHDRITGAAALALAREHYVDCKRVLIIHTSPEEIEWHKEAREDSTSAERAEERKREQIGLAKECDLVVAVGPHLAKEFGTDLRGAGCSVPLFELTPGLPEHSAKSAKRLPPSIRCLILGRIEDYQLKGLDLAAKSLGLVIANWKHGDAPKLVVRGAPVGTDAALRKRLNADSAPTELDVVVRHYSADETAIRGDLMEASLVIMPSKKEGFGLVGLEAIACGVPTLVSAASGLAATLSLCAPKHANEWILPVTGDAVAKWADRIEFLLTSRESAFARAEALRSELVTQLNWRREASRLLERVSAGSAS